MSNTSFILNSYVLIIQNRRALGVLFRQLHMLVTLNKYFQCVEPVYLSICKMGDSVSPSKLFLKEDAATERTDHPTCTGTQEASRNLMGIQTVTHWSEVAPQVTFVTSSQTKTITWAMDSTLTSKHRHHEAEHVPQRPSCSQEPRVLTARCPLLTSVSNGKLSATTLSWVMSMWTSCPDVF